jgi:hypothetical protein
VERLDRSTPSGEYELSSIQRRALRELVAGKRRELSGKLDVRWLDLTARPIHVVEANGGIVLEHATEAMDIRLGRIPDIGAKLPGYQETGRLLPQDARSNQDGWDE